MRKKSNILIVNRNLDARVRLREALKNAIFDSSIDQVKSPSEALARFEGGAGFDVVFIESLSETGKIQEFIQKLEQFRKGKNTIVIVTLKAQHLDSAYIASLFLEGVEGFICEPYSTAEIQSIFQTTKETASKGVNESDRRHHLIDFLLLNAQQNLDKVAQDRANGDEQGGYAMRELRAISKNLRELEKKDPATYAEAIVNRFSNIAPPKVVAHAGPRKQKKLVRHPGYLIREALAARRLSPDRVQGLLKVDPKEFEEMLNEKRNLDEAMARDVARLLGDTQSYWMRLQREYDAAAQKRLEMEKKRAEANRAEQA